MVILVDFRLKVRKMKRLLTIGMVAVAAFSQATILTFDVTGNTVGVFMDDAYGDNVTAATMGNFGYDISNGITPDVTVSYSGGTAGQLSWWSTGYSDLTNVIYYEPDGSSPMRVTFTGSNGQNAVLNSFDLGNFGGEVTLPGLTVRDGSGNLLWSALNVTVPIFTSPALNFNVGGVAAEVLVLEVDLTGLGSSSDNIGLDNISFSQEPVPEPMTLVALAAGGLLLRRRKLS